MTGLEQPFRQQVYDVTYQLYAQRYAKALAEVNDPKLSFTAALLAEARTFSLAGLDADTGIRIILPPFDSDLSSIAENIAAHERAADPGGQLNPYTRTVQAIQSLELSARTGMVIRPTQAMQEVCSLGVIAALHKPFRDPTSEPPAAAKIHRRLFERAEGSLNSLLEIPYGIDEAPYMIDPRIPNKDAAAAKAAAALARAGQDPNKAPLVRAYINKTVLFSLSAVALQWLEAEQTTRQRTELEIALLDGTIPPPIERERRILHDPPTTRVDLLMFPPEHLGSRAVREGKEQANSRSGSTQESVVEEYRIKWLGFLVLAWGNDSELTEVPLHYSGKSKYQAAILRDEKREVVAVVADNPILGNALYVLIPGELRDPATRQPVPWENVITGSRARAIGFGAHQFIHSSPNMYEKVMRLLIPLSPRLQEISARRAA